MRRFRNSYIALAAVLIDRITMPTIIGTRLATCATENSMSDLNNANPTPPAEVKARLQEAAEESKKLDSPQRTNDSTIDPEKPKEEILKGFHGG